MTKKQQADFEKRKNTQAAGWTVSITAALLLIFFLVSWDTPKPELPLKEDLVEIDLGEMNLGNTDNGKGEIQPLVPGDYAAQQEDDAPQKSKPAPAEDAADPLTDDNNEDAPEVVKQIQKPVKPSTNFPDHQVSQNSPNRTPVNTPPAQPTTAQPRTRAIMSAPNHNGPGGNGADDYNNSRSQGNGNRFGDQGDPNGSPNGNGTGPRKLNNSHIVNKGILNQEGTNYKGQITLGLRVDENGSVTGVTSVSASPASDASSEAKSFARGIAGKIKFPPGAADRTATVKINFNMDN